MMVCGPCISQSISNIISPSLSLSLLPPILVLKTNGDLFHINRIAEQLGYCPTNTLNVAARTSSGKPAVVQCYPLVATKKGTPEPFPTMFWLTCPDIKAEVIDFSGSWI